MMINPKLFLNKCYVSVRGELEAACNTKDPEEQDARLDRWIEEIDHEDYERCLGHGNFAKGILQAIKFVESEIPDELRDKDLEARVYKLLEVTGE